MRVHRPLDDLVTGKTSVRVLRALALYPRKESTGRELAALAGGAPSKVIAELNRLKGFGLVARRTFGRTHVWKVNEEHELFRLLAPAFALERRLHGELTRELQASMDDPRISRAVLFGSFARGDEGPESDVDLLVVAKERSDVERVRSIVYALSIRLGQRFGLQLSPIVHAERDLSAFRKTPLSAALKEEGLVIRGALP